LWLFAVVEVPVPPWPVPLRRSGLTARKAIAVWLTWKFLALFQRLTGCLSGQCRTAG